MQFEKTLYSAPFRLIGQRLWLKATPGQVRLFLAHLLVATHPRALAPGQRSTLPDHLPLQALAWSLADPQHCRAAAERYERTSTLVTSNLDIDEWADAFPANRVLGAATVDRLRHGAYRNVLDGASYRTPRPLQDFL